ncbi:CehA/McbA family metallohydrolase [bacterium]|nr:CehA/McbA family metallohydrolase [bacterium]
MFPGNSNGRVVLLITLTIISLNNLSCQSKPIGSEQSWETEAEVSKKPVLENDPGVFFWEDGQIGVTPDHPIPVNSRGTWTVRFTTASQTISDKGSIIFIVTPFWGWSPPQTTDPAREGYTTVNCSAASTHFSVTTLGENMLLIMFGSAGFKPGDVLMITYGDTSNGQYPMAQARADRFAETAPVFFIKVDATGKGQYALVRNTPDITTTSLPEAQIVGTCPTEVLKDRPFRIRFAAVDRYGHFNRQAVVSFHFYDQREGINQILELTEDNAGVLELTVQFHESGWHHPSIADESGTYRRELNPVHCLEALPQQALFWGDIHGHSSLSDGSGSVDDYFTYARDVAALDFTALTDHDFHGFKPLKGENWALTKKAVQHYHQDGFFVVFLGYEWTSWRFGHRNVYYPDTQGEVFACTSPDSDTLPELWTLIAPFAACTIPHHVAGGPIAADWNFHDPAREWLVEISSIHGTTEMLDCPGMIYKPEPGHFVGDALLKGYKLGIMASGDSHDGRPGAEPRTGEIRGMIALRAPVLTRQALWQSMQHRTGYGTSGARIFLEFTLNEQPMGRELVFSNPHEKRIIKAQAVGQQYMEEMVLVKDSQVIARVSGHDYEVSLEYEDDEPIQKEHFYYVRARQMDGQMAWSSPIWVTNSSVTP